MAFCVQPPPTGRDLLLVLVLVLVLLVLLVLVLLVLLLLVAVAPTSPFIAPISVGLRLRHHLAHLRLDTVGVRATYYNI